MMRHVIADALLIALSSLLAGSAHAVVARDDAAEEKLGWHLCLQASSIPDASAFEAIDLAAKLGLAYVELDPDQALCAEERDVHVGPDMTSEQLYRLQRKLKDAHVKVASFGVVGFRNDEASARKTFDFAKAMGVETLICQPMPDACKLVDRLCNEYKIDAAIYNPEKPARYWQPEDVASAMYWCSHHVGACADIANWSRSGLERRECMYELRGQILAVRLRDPDGIAAQFGSRHSTVRDLLIELHERRFRGVICLECTTAERASADAELARRIEVVDAAARALAAETLIEVQVSNSLSVPVNWYQGPWRRSDADDVECRVVQLDDRSLVVHVASKEERKTSGIGVDIRLSKNERGVVEAHASGLWWSDRGPSRDALDSIKGTMSISSADFEHARPLSLQFNLDTNWSGCPKTVSGGIRIPR